MSHGVCLIYSIKYLFHAFISLAFILFRSLLHIWKLISPSISSSRWSVGYFIYTQVFFFLLASDKCNFEQNWIELYVYKYISKLRKIEEWGMWPWRRGLTDSALRWQNPSATFSSLIKSLVWPREWEIIDDMSEDNGEMRCVSVTVLYAFVLTATPCWYIAVHKYNSARPYRHWLCTHSTYSYMFPTDTPSLLLLPLYDVSALHLYNFTSFLLSFFLDQKLF